MKTFIAFLLLMIPAAAFPCNDQANRQFDFWVGTWNVLGPKGKIAGTNRVSKINGGCAILEEWSGNGGIVGKSLNIYDATRKVWHQTWVGSDGLLLTVEGKFENGAMRMSNATDRITWTPLSEGLRQVWEQTSDGGKTWAVVFDGKYVPVKENP